MYEHFSGSDFVDFHHHDSLLTVQWYHMSVMVSENPSTRSTAVCSTACFAPPTPPPPPPPQSKLLSSLLALWEGNPPVTIGFPSQRASIPVNVRLPSYKGLVMWEVFPWHEVIMNREDGSVQMYRHNPSYQIPGTIYWNQGIGSTICNQAHDIWNISMVGVNTSNDWYMQSQAGAFNCFEAQWRIYASII